MAFVEWMTGRDDYVIGPVRISHDEGETWHEVGAQCAECVSREGKAPGEPVATITRVNYADGVITVNTKRR